MQFSPRKPKRQFPLFLALVGLMACGDQLATTASGTEDGAEATESALNGPFLYLPVNALYEVTNDFDGYANHRALDFGVSYQPVYAAHEGTASVRGYDSNCGYFLYIIHPSNGFRTKYCHLSQFSVSDGAYVGRGAQIGISGNTGYSTGPHLHFAVCVGGDCGMYFGNAVSPGCPAGVPGVCNDAAGAYGNLWVTRNGRVVLATEPDVLNPPGSLVLSSSGGQLTLTWSAGEGADHYRVFRGTSSGQESYFSWTRGLSFTDAPPPGQRFFYFVRSVSSDGRESGNSNEVSGLVIAPPSIGATVSYGRISIAWSAVSGASQYRVFRGTSPGGETFLAATGATRFDDTALALGTKYFYVVRSVASSGAESANSNEVSATANPKRRSPCYAGTAGDVNLNGWVDDDDPQLVAKAEVGAVTLTADQIARADVNKDGAVTISDAWRISRFLISPNDPATFPVCARGFLGDVNCDGARSSTDAQLVLKAVAGLASFSISCPSAAGSVNIFAANMDKSTGTTVQQIITARDAQLILDCAAGLNSCLTQ